MMKKQVVVILSMMLGITVFGQKNELKSADRALSKNDLATAKESLNQAEKLIGNADEKLVEKYYFLKGKTYYNISKAQPKLAAESLDKSADALKKLLVLEKKSGHDKYSKEAAPILNKLLVDIQNQGKIDYKNKKYGPASDAFYKVYLLSKKDTFLLDNAASTAFLAKDYPKAIKFYQELINIGYTGVYPIYLATNKKTGKVDTFGSKLTRDLSVKAGTDINPLDKNSKSRRISILKNIAILYGKTKNYDKALATIQKARQEEPNNYNLLLSEADIYMQKGDRLKYTEIMKEVIVKDPSNPVIYFNLGVLSNEQKKPKEAIGYYEKAIELNPNYYDAYINLAGIKREKEKGIIDEMNKNISDFDKYDALKAKQMKLYKDILPLYEKAYSIKSDDIQVVQTLLGIYENLGMDAKAKAMKTVYDKMRK